VTRQLIDIPFSFLYSALLIFFFREPKNDCYHCCSLFLLLLSLFFLLLLLARYISISTHFLYLFVQVLQFLFVVKMMKKKSHTYLSLYSWKRPRKYTFNYYCMRDHLFVFCSFFLLINNKNIKWWSYSMSIYFLMKYLTNI